MGLYSTTRTVTATVTEIEKMVEVQRKARETLGLSGVTESVITNTFISYGSSILGLVFNKSAIAGVSSGWLGLLTSLNAAEKQALIDDVNNGYMQLLEDHFSMTKSNWAKINMTITDNRERIGYDFAFIKSRKINYYVTPTGEKAYA